MTHADSIEPDGADATERILDFLRPVDFGVPLSRVGGRFDGGYLIPRDLSGITDCFSPGADNRKRFEDEIVLRFGIRTHIADYSSDAHRFETPLIKGKQTFEKKWISASTNDDSNALSLGDWIQRTKPSSAGDLMMQMDIEGAEYEVLEALDEPILGRFRVLVIELHNLSKILDAECESKILSVIEKLKKHFYVAHAHPNNCCGEFWIPKTRHWFPDVMEITCLRIVDRPAGLLTGGTAVSPHPQDIWWNKKLKRPLHLDKSFLRGRRPLAAYVRAIWDIINYEIRWSTHQRKLPRVRGVLRQIRRL